MFTTPPLSIVDLPADIHHYGGIRRPIEMIVLHDTEGTDSRKWLSTDPNSRVSCHRLIDRDGIIYKIVPDNEVAWTQGYGSLGGKGYQDLNPIALSIELENMGTKGNQEYPYKQLESCALQVIEWWGMYGSLPILYHTMIDAGKRDPLRFPRAYFDAILFDKLRRIFRNEM